MKGCKRNGISFHLSTPWRSIPVDGSTLNATESDAPEATRCCVFTPAALLGWSLIP